jgi:hypothetical protein
MDEIVGTGLKSWNTRKSQTDGVRQSAMGVVAGKSRRGGGGVAVASIGISVEVSVDVSVFVVAHVGRYWAHNLLQKDERTKETNKRIYGVIERKKTNKEL